MKGWNSVPPSVCVVCVIVLLQHLPLTSSLCPSSCDCRNNRAGQPVSIDCRHRNHHDVIRNIFPSVVELDLSDNPIAQLNRSSFPSLPALYRLTMENCLIERLEQMTFRNLEALEILELSRNRIRSIDDSAFTGLTSLRELRLADNQLESVPGYVFRALSLSVLDISGNKLSEISDETFEAASIDWLNLDRNRFEILNSRSFRPLSNSLTKLTVNHNGEKLSFASDTFAALKLSVLSVALSGISDVSFLSQLWAGTVDLSGNEFGAARFPRSLRLSESCRDMVMHSSQLSKFTDNLANSLGVVRNLDLHNNTLTSIDGALFRWMPKISTLDLSMNFISRLSDNFSVSLGSVKSLNLSRSGLRSFGHSGMPFAGARSLESLDISYNHLQVFPEPAFKSILEKLSTVNLTGNSVHCNCEAAWLQSWLNKASKDVGSVKCVDAKSGHTENILSRNPSDFFCLGPRILHITPNLNLDEGQDALLSCTSQSDPAAEIVWRSPFGEVFSITPPFDRTVTGTYAAWQISRIKPDQAGWYVCNAQNIQASVVQYTYVHVVTPSLPPVDLQDLKYPNIPSVLLVSTVSPASGGRSDKSPVEQSPTAYNRIVTSPDYQPRFAEKTGSEYSGATKFVNFSNEAQVQSSDGLFGPSTVTANDRKRTGRIAIIITVVVIVVLLIVAGIVFGLMLRRQRRIQRRGRYSVKRKYDEEINRQDQLPDVTLTRKTNPERLPLHDKTSPIDM